MNDPIPASFLSVVACILIASGNLSADQSRATGGDYVLIYDATGNSGGQVSSDLYIADTATGSSVGVGVLLDGVEGNRMMTGYTGQLYDTLGLEILPDPSKELSEGEAIQLTAELSLDDDTLLRTPEINWSAESGPVTVDDGGLVVATAIVSDSTASVTGAAYGFSGEILLSISNLPHETNSLTWPNQEPDAAGNTRYTVYFGTNPDSLPEVATPTRNFYNPGPLTSGRTFYYRILDSRGNDITPGGAGPQSFTTNLYRPDVHIGKRPSMSSQRGNGIYNRNGRKQRLRLRLDPGGRENYHFTVENDGDIGDRHILRTSRVGRRNLGMQIFLRTGRRQNVTAKTLHLGFLQPSLEPGQHLAYQAKAKSKRFSRTRISSRILAISANDWRAVDLGKARIRIKAR